MCLWQWYVCICVAVKLKLRELCYILCCGSAMHNSQTIHKLTIVQKSSEGKHLNWLWAFNK